MNHIALEQDDPREIGPYRIVARLGSGGMADVFLGRSPGGRAVAIKAIHQHLAEDARFVARFAREVRAAKAVGSFFTATVVDADWSAPRPWLASEYIAAPTLKQVVAQQGPLTEAAVEVLAMGIVEALTAIHAAGVVHRDLTPGNVLVTETGPRVIDFGISRAVTQTQSLTATGALIGSPGFMSPEHIAGDEVGTASDVFSLGAVLTFALTGEGPFGPAPLGDLLYRAMSEEPDLSGVPEGRLYRIITACLAKEPAARPGMEQLAAALDLVPDRVTAQGDRTPPGFVVAGTPRRRIGRRTVLAGIGALGLGAAIGADSPSGEVIRSAARAPGPAPGAIRWKADIGVISDIERTAPAVSGGSVVVGSADGNVYALETTTGDVAWKVDLGREIFRVPVIADSAAVTSVAGKGIVALDARTGTQLWSSGSSSVFFLVGADPATIFGFPKSDRGIQALDPATGALRWSLWDDRAIEGARVNLSTGSGRVAIQYGGTLTVLDATTGAELWRTATAAFACPYIVGAKVLVAKWGAPQLKAFGIESGTELWGFDPAGGDRIAVEDGVVYNTGISAATVYAVDVETGALRRRTNLDDAPAYDITVGDGTMYLTTGDSVLALDANTGAAQWKTAIGKSQGGVTVADRTAYVCADQSLFAIAT
ncbi:protein kinase domain-containing protein [Nocardia takedensis]